MALQITLTSGLLTIVLPGVALWYGSLGVVDKAAALLWALYLVAGPDPNILRWVCWNVRSITTDMGTERLIAQMRDLVPGMFRVLGAPRAPLMSRMFPFASPVAGWLHFWDLMLQKLLNSMRFFPRWITAFKVMGLRANHKFFV